MDNNNQSKLEVAVGLSRKWDAREAGREVAKTAIKKLNQPPSFFLLYSTIHYKDHGGFQELLDGVWDVLPSGTPLIGGTIASFINNYGCFARGATALTISYPKMDAVVGFGKRTKLFPKIAARNCAHYIKEGLKKSNYPNRFIIDMISAPTVPKIPIIGRVNFIKSRFFGWIACAIGVRTFPVFGHGLGKEEDLIDELTKLMPDYYLIGGSSIDAGKYFYNYQFIEKQVYTNSIVALGCSIDLPIFLKTMLGVHETDKSFKVTSTMYNNRIIKKINKKPAKEQFLKVLGITEEQFGDIEVFYSRTANYFPIVFEENKNYTTGTAGFFGDNIALGYKARGNKGRLLSITGHEILDAVDKIFSNGNENKLPFAFMSSSFIFLNTLRDYSHLLKKKLDEYFKDIPYLVMFPTSENVGLPGSPAFHRVYSFNALSIQSN